MIAKIKRDKSGNIKAECGKCGRFLAEVPATTQIILKCSSCKAQNSINVVYSHR